MYIFVTGQLVNGWMDVREFNGLASRDDDNFTTLYE